VSALSPGDRAALLAEARRLMAQPLRRRFLRQGATLGGLMLLTGCDLSSGDDAEALLMRVSRFNDRVQAALFDPRRLAPVYPESMVTRPFPFNAYYAESEAPQVQAEGFMLAVTGKVAQPGLWTLDELGRLPQAEHITRHICVEGWSAIGRWGGVPFGTFLAAAGADLQARFVGFRCADDYYTSIDMPTALHPQTLLTLRHDGQTLPRRHGFPMKLRIPTKLGYKNPKHIVEIFVTNDYPGGYWEDQGYNWFGGS
jgi:DMSO/TMAO reductase YedYZ molybdopterin-dependent catalytic subunit